MTILVQVEVEVSDANTLDETKLPASKVEPAVKEAVRECLQHGENRGFNHPLSDKLALSIGRIRASVVQE